MKNERRHRKTESKNRRNGNSGGVKPAAAWESKAWQLKMKNISGK
jgi:hypothetical protein